VDSNLVTIGSGV